MRVSTRVEQDTDGRWLVVEVRPEAGEGSTPRAELAGRVAHVELPTAVDLPHPDVRALVALLCVVPWVRGGLTLDHAVSGVFAEAVHRATGRRVGPVDEDLAPRERPAGARRALAYSGGTDCTAAAALMPDPTGLYFLERTEPRAPGHRGGGRASVYDLSAARHSCRVMQEHGFLVRRVRSDLEHLREPVGFPHDLANIVPALVWADADRLDAVAWGAPLEAVYRLQVGRFQPFDQGAFHRWSPVFRAVGLDLLHVVAGVSEPGTTEIVRRWPAGQAAQSCMRGRPGQPCLACWKCARKELLQAAVARHRDGVEADLRRLERILHEPEPVRVLRSSPPKVEISLAHTVRTVLAGREHDRRDVPVLDALERAVSPVPTDFLWRSYPPALNAGVPKRLREEVRARIAEFLDPLDDEGVRAVRRYDATAWRGSAEQLRAQADLQRALDQATRGPQLRSLAGRVRRRVDRRLRSRD